MGGGGGEGRGRIKKGNKVDPFFRQFLGWTGPIHSVLTEIFEHFR